MQSTAKKLATRARLGNLVKKIVESCDPEQIILFGSQARGDAGVGGLVLEGRTGETATDGDGVRLWAGHVKDSFYVDLSLLAIVNGAVARQNGRYTDARAGVLVKGSARLWRERHHYRRQPCGRRRSQPAGELLA